MGFIIKAILLVVSVGVGFAAVTQLQNISPTNAADNSRDILELRQTLREEQEHRQELYERIRENERLLEEYKAEQKNSREFAMKEAVANLEEKAGLTEVSGPGITIELKKAGATHANTSSSEVSLTPVLLRRLVNELYSFGAKEISIEGERILETTAFRDIGGAAHINGNRLPALPVQIKIIADDPEQVHNQFIVSESAEYFSFENVEPVSTVKDEVTIPAYDEIRRVRHMEAVEED
ncbi:DUF881 domain-containing protein [Alteribacillus bidgolensis]|uniref:Uncharacterized conserved protein YlxW, UPF0749 family n=1 Tax=Alteribacillus bidgolensis TaxID=930129 RepID=A0A1G8G9R0_9BACI|nr:DUF881 domain-containing protein [Alteribacillus bidgolensis]SDH91127.1 Uncharacterized conserved protein YlxW, UPF0749 family [Alteribacillus bidgolensis]